MRGVREEAQRRRGEGRRVRNDQRRRERGKERTLRIVRASFAYSHRTSPSSGDASCGCPALRRGSGCQAMYRGKEGRGSLWVNRVYRVVHHAEREEKRRKARRNNSEGMYRVRPVT